MYGLYCKLFSYAVTYCHLVEGDIL